MLKEKNKIPKVHIGVWIDHRDAFIVNVSRRNAEITHLTSNVERQLRRSTVAPYDVTPDRHGAQVTPADDSQQRAYTVHLSRYYHEIIEKLRPADSLLIMGPGEAKGELEKLCRKEGPEDRVLSMETVDNMSEGQMVEKFRQHFNLKSPDSSRAPAGT